MSKGFIGINEGKGKVRRKGSFIVRSALVLSVLAAFFISYLALTIRSSNTLMNIDRVAVSNVPSNVLPSYSTCSFESADNQTNLSGWFFRCEDPITTIIVVHDTGGNRMQFGVNMVDMIENWLDNNYNVFLFDLRNSGDSGGEKCAYGYLEWQDVIGAINQVRTISVTTDVVLFGIGTGCTSCMLAYDNLPPAGISDSELERYPSNITSLEFDRSYIKGMIFDSPAMNSDDYIKPVVRRNEFLGELTAYSVPYAIRLSSGVSSNVNMVAEISRLPIPVCIIYGGHDTFIGAEKIVKIIDERNRLNSSITMSVMIPGAGYLESFKYGKDTYISTIMRFMQSYFIEG